MTATGDSLLLTDLYQLNMMQAYEQNGLTDVALFELFVRKLPAKRGFLMAAGLAQVVEFLETLRFSADDIAYLARNGRFDPGRDAARAAAGRSPPLGAVLLSHAGRPRPSPPRRRVRRPGRGTRVRAP